MALSEAFLEWEQATQQRAEIQGQRSLILRQLEQSVGQLSQQERDRIACLSLEQLEALAIALLNFSTIDDLEAWLDANR